MRREFVWFPVFQGEPTEQRFMSDPGLWPKSGKLYALASDADAVASVYAHATALAKRIAARKAAPPILVEQPSRVTLKPPIMRRPPAGIFKRPTI